MKTTFLKWMVVVAGAGLATAVIQPRLARSADHLDAPATMADATGDINDVYTFLDGTKAVFAMTTFPAAPAGTKFSDKVQYVFHTSSGAAFPAATSDYNIICQFDAAQVAECWGGTDEYAKGDASTALESADKKMKIFAGLRGDPFFFNLDGFKETVKTVDTALGTGLVQFNDAGCPTVDGTALQTILKSNPDAAAPGPEDFFKKLNGLAIVVQIDKTLVTKGGPIVAVWASTNKRP